MGYCNPSEGIERQFCIVVVAMFQQPVETTVQLWSWQRTPPVGALWYDCCSSSIRIRPPA
jgi:hypothetical protein